MSFSLQAQKIAASFRSSVSPTYPLTLVVFACKPLMGVVSVKLNQLLRERFRQQRFQIGELNATIEDSLLGQRVVKASQPRSWSAKSLSRATAILKNQDAGLSRHGGLQHLHPPF